jgi:PAS domain S-box-containing protein
MYKHFPIQVLLGFLLLLSLLLIWPLTILPPEARLWALFPALSGVTLLCTSFIGRKDPRRLKARPVVPAETDEKYRVLVEEAAEGIFILDSNGNYLEVNPSGVELTGYTPEELCRMNVKDLVTAESQLENPIRTPDPDPDKAEPLYAQRTLRRKDGRIIQAEVSARRLRNGTVMSVIRDVTERREAEEELHRSEKKYRFLFYDNPLPMWMFSRQDFRFISVNDAAIAQYGFSREEFLSMTIFDIRPEQDREALAATILNPERGIRHSGVWQHRRKDGSLLYAEIISHDTRFEEQEVRLVLAIDVTAKRKAEQLLQKAYEDSRRLAAHLEHVREEERLHIAREIHDELGQQLTALKMDISWLARKFDDADGAVREKFAELMVMADSTVQTVRRISSDLRPGMLEDLGLTATLEWYNEGVARRTDLAIDFQARGEEPVLPPLVAVTLYRIYQESITNVIRHAGASRVEVQLYYGEDALTLSVSDNGNGFDLQEAEQRRTLGLLGLRERVTLIRGTLTLDSAPGKGTLLHVQVPLPAISNETA